MPLKILGVGMPRTGTASLCEALRILGYNAIHHAPERIDLDTVNADSFKGVYDDVDAVLDMPAAYFWREILETYGSDDVKIILTVRNEHTWWESIKFHAHKIRVSDDIKHIRYTDQLHRFLFGAAEPQEYMWKRAYCEWNRELDPRCAADPNGLVLDICGGDKWEPICEFLDKPIPKEQFPWNNQKRGNAHNNLS